MKIVVAKSIDALPSGWDKFVVAHERATIFHSKPWLQILCECYRYEFFGVYALDDAGELQGILPAWMVNSFLTGKRLVASPFSYICDPLANSEGTAEELVKKAIETCGAHKARYFELKCRYPVSIEKVDLAESRQYETFLLDLEPTLEALWAATHKGIIQRGVNKAQKEGVEIRVVNDEKAVEGFHLLNLLTCRKHGIPAQPLRFHREVLRMLVKSGNAEFHLAYLGEIAIAGVVVFYFNKTATYMYGASDERYLMQRPNHLLIWEAIKRAKERGMRVFDLGRVSDDNPGLKEFKQRWGAKEAPLHYYYWPEKKGVGAVNRKSLRFKLTTFMFSKTPMAVTKRLTWLYRHLG